MVQSPKRGRNMSQSAIEHDEKDRAAKFASAYIESVISDFRRALISKKAFHNNEVAIIVSAVRESLITYGRVHRPHIENQLIKKGFEKNYAHELSKALS